MGVISSTALYLSAPLPAVGAASGADTVARSVPASSTSGSAAPTMSFAVTVIDLPAPAAGARRSLDEAIADEVRRDAAGSPTPAATDAPADDGAGQGDLDEAVVAAHDARIAFLRERIAAARTGDAAAPQIRAMRERLRRAEAARELALARTRPGAQMAACAEDGGPASCRPAAAAVTASSSGSRYPLARPVPGARQVAARAASTHPVSVADAAGPAVRAATPHGAGQRPAADASAHARRLLAAARRLLEADTGADARVPAPVSLAGLWHWNGSDRWSLADYPNRSA